jgi:hypothetical protein
MNPIVEVNEEGALYLPADVLEQVKPHRRFIVEVSNGTLVLRPKTQAKPFWATATPEEWVQSFRQWVASHKTGPNLPQEALSRESIYE